MRIWLSSHTAPRTSKGEVRLLVGAERGQAANFAQRSLCRFHLELRRDCTAPLACLLSRRPRAVSGSSRSTAPRRGDKTRRCICLMAVRALGHTARGARAYTRHKHGTILDTHGRRTAASLPLPLRCLAWLVQARVRRANDDGAHTRPSKSKSKSASYKQQRSWLHSIIQHRPPTAIRRTTPGNLPSYFSYQASNHHHNTTLYHHAKLYALHPLHSSPIPNS